MSCYTSLNAINSLGADKLLPKIIRKMPCGNIYTIDIISNVYCYIHCACGKTHKIYMCVCYPHCKKH